jgi:hypothetical protein
MSFPDTITNPTMNTRQDVRRWFRAMRAHGVNFHPEDSFADMVDNAGVASFTSEEATNMDDAMAKAYDVAGDPCAIALEVLHAGDDDRVSALADASDEAGEIADGEAVTAYVALENAVGVFLAGGNAEAIRLAGGVQ